MKILLHFLFVLNSYIFLFPQHGDPSLLSIGVLNGNKLNVSFGNDGQISGTRQGIDVRGLWEGNNYIGDMTPMIGIELPIKDYTGDGINDTIHSVIISRGPRNHQAEERDPEESYFYGFNPLPGYMNYTNFIPARSDNPTTWPISWPDHPEYEPETWNSVLGPVKTVDFLETYFRMDDFYDREVNKLYGFYPDSADHNIPGLGIEVSVRYIQLSNDLFDDVIYRIYDVTNNSDFPYDKVIYGNISGTLVGGDGDSGDDLGDYDSLDHIAYSLDYDSKGNKGQQIGVMGESIIKSPSEERISSFSFFNLSTAPDMRNDELLWNRMKPGRFQYSPIPQDGDLIYSTGYFSLEPGETKRIVSVIAMGYTKEDVGQTIYLSEALLNNLFNIDALRSSVLISNLNSYQTLPINQDIKWTSREAGGSVDIWFSKDAGKSWLLVDKSQPNSGTYTVNTDGLSDCAFGLFRIFLRNNEGNITGFDESSYFSIDNPTTDGRPFVKILNPGLDSLGTITDDEITLKFLAGDPEKDSLNLNILFSNDGINYLNYKSYKIPSDSSMQSIVIKLSELANSDSCRFRINIDDGTYNATDSTKLFAKFNNREIVPSQYIEKISGESEVELNLVIINRSLLTGDEYLITINDTASVDQKYFSIFNLTQNKPSLNNIIFSSDRESAMFDGMSFISKDFTTALDTAHSNWNMGLSKSFEYNMARFRSDPDFGYAAPNDYRIIFYDTVVDTSVELDDYINVRKNIPAKPVYFKVFNIKTNEQLKTVYNKTGLISSSNRLFLVENILGREKLTWDINITSNDVNNNPTKGDTLLLYTKKGLSIYDTIKIKNISLAVEEDMAGLNSYSLGQNYPNPFNPTTIISYINPSENLVTLKVFDVLGREVKTLVNEVQIAGNYKVSFNAGGLASGVYFYRIEMGKYSNTKKFMILK